MKRAVSIVTRLLSVAAVLAYAASAGAEPIKCQRSILKESGKYAQTRIRALSKCESDKIAGKLAPSTDCLTEPKAFAAMAKAALKLSVSLDKSCGGIDKQCVTPGDGNDTPASIGWPAVCPDFEELGCDDPITTCGDIATCLRCINEKAVDQVRGLYYGALLASTPGTPINRCQSAIGKAGAAFFKAKTRALDKCWDGRHLGKHTNNCPVPGDGKTLLAIQKAETKAISAIVKACDGLDPSAIGFTSQCPAVTIPGGASCNAPVADVGDMVACVQCVTEFKVDCSVPLAVPWYVPYPAECGVPPATPTATPTVTVTPTPTRTATPTPSTTPTPVVNKCLAGKMKAEGKAAAAYLKCHARGASREEATDAGCLAKASLKMVGAFAKLDAKGGCLIVGDGPARDTDTAAFGVVIDGLVGHVGKCDAAKDRLVGKYVAARFACYAKAAGKTGLVDPTCLAKAAIKFQTSMTKAEAKPPCSNLGQAAALLVESDDFVQEQICLLSPGDPSCVVTAPTPTPTPSVTTTPTATGGGPTTTPTPVVPPTCNNGSDDPGEACDPTTAPAGWATCGPAFACTASCNCACPTKIHFAGDAADPATILDAGWNGIAHRAKVISNGDVTVSLACGASARPCGVCTVSGPVANTGATQLRNRRCTNDLSIQCTMDGQCATQHCLGGPNEDAACTTDTQCPGSACSSVGTCQYFFGGPLPLVAGGVGTCVSNQFNGPVSGTANVETGEAATIANLTSRVYSAIATDNPCPRCLGDVTINDDVLGGTCAGGPRDGSACDANGAVPGRPDFGRTSLDCPPSLTGIIATLPIDLTNSTGTVSKAVTASSPTCTGDTSKRCVCDTCNNALAEPCDSNADCPVSGGNPGICGGRRCLGGTNDGGPCGGAGGGASACPGGGTCGRPGEPTKPNACVDNSTTPIVDGTLCVDTAPMGDNEGECPEGPPTGICSVASGHGQRSCSSNNDCCDDPPLCAGDPPGPSDCVITNRFCFLDNGLGGVIEGDGAADPPVQDTSDPTLAAVFCIGPTSAPAVNAAAGLPGPGRTTLKGTATGNP